MMRTYAFAKSTGTARCVFADGRSVDLPVFAGILKHPEAGELPRLLSQPEVAAKYTREALRIAPWQMLREFPADWLKQHLGSATLRPGRRRALEFLLSSLLDEAGASAR